MRYKLLAALVFISCGLQAQQINPVPDYVFQNRMSVGRTTVTDTLAYFSIGPRYGAIRGFMPPMVVDTALVTGGTKRNGLTIFSIQKNKYVYWDSVGSKWAEMAGTGGSAINSGDTASMLSPYTRGSGTTNYLPKFTGTRTFGNSQITDDGTTVTVPSFNFQTNGPMLTGANAWATTTLAFGTTTNHSLLFYTNNTEKARLTNGGFFGIGKTPTVALDVNGSILASGVLISSNTPFVTGNNISTSSGTTAIGATSASPLLFFTSNSERARITSDGELLINSSVDAGAYALQVAGSIYNTTGAVFATSSGGLSIGTTTVYNNYILNNAGASQPVLALQNNGTGSASTDGFQLSVAGNHAYLWNYEDALMLFGTNGTERMRIQGNGEVLIGTTTDAGAYALQVAGSIYNTTGAAFAASSGSVGIGTTSPSRKLHVNGSGTIVRLTSSSETNPIEFASPSGFAYIGQKNGPNLYMETNGQERLRVASDGNIGIGTSTPTAKLHVNGPLLVQDMTDTSINIRGTDSLNVNFGITWTTDTYRGGGIAAIRAARRGSTDASDLMFYTAQNGSIPLERARLTSSGELLLGSTSDAGIYALQVTGNIYNTGSITTGAPSGGSIKPWKLGETATVSPTSPNRTIRVEIDGTVYYLHAKTTND